MSRNGRVRRTERVVGKVFKQRHVLIESTDAEELDFVTIKQALAAAPLLGTREGARHLAEVADKILGDLRGNVPVREIETHVIERLGHEPDSIPGCAARMLNAATVYLNNPEAGCKLNFDLGCAYTELRYQLFARAKGKTRKLPRSNRYDEKLWAFIHAHARTVGDVSAASAWKSIVGPSDGDVYREGSALVVHTASGEYKIGFDAFRARWRGRKSAAN